VSVSVDINKLTSVDLNTHWIVANSEGGISIEKKPGLLGRFFVWIFGSSQGELDLKTVSRRIQTLIDQVPQGDKSSETLGALRGKLIFLEQKSRKYQSVFQNCISLIDGKTQPASSRLDLPSVERPRAPVSAPEPKQAEALAPEQAEAGATAPVQSAKASRLAMVSKFLNRDFFKPLWKSTDCERELLNTLGHKVGEESEELLKERVRNRLIHEKVSLRDKGTVALIIMEERAALAGLNPREKAVIAELLVLVRELEGMGAKLPSDSLRQLYVKVLKESIGLYAEKMQKTVGGDLDSELDRSELTRIFQSLSESPRTLWLVYCDRYKEWAASQSDIAGGGLCWAVGVDVAAYLTKAPRASAKSLHDHLSGASGKLDDPKAIFQPRHEAMQATYEASPSDFVPIALLQQLGIEKENEHYLGQAQGENCGRKVFKELKALNNKGGLRESSGVFMLSMEGNDGAHLIPCQVSKEEDRYRIIDPNYGMFEFNDLASFQEGFISFIDACYSEYDKFWVNNFIPAT
jgi:Yersinia/Haemophilus virulence surface antigen